MKAKSFLPIILLATAIVTAGAGCAPRTETTDRIDSLEVRISILESRVERESENAALLQQNIVGDTRNVEQCLSDVDAEYERMWDERCRYVNTRDGENPDQKCYSLPPAYFRDIDATRQQHREDCYALNP